MQENNQKPSIFEPISLFSKDPDFNFVFKKGQKLVGALYLVTGFLSDSEPLKWAIRDMSNDLLSTLIFIKDKMSGRRDECINEIKKTVFDIISRIEVASFAGLISDMNAEIFKREFSTLIERLEAGDRGSMGPVLLSSSLFDVPAPKVEDRRELQSFFPPENNGDKGQNPQNNLNNRVNNHKGPKASLKHKKDNRRDTILNIIAKRGEVNIKDISNLMKDCSEKTIQRELGILVEEGRVKKEGDRRWSRYSLS